MSLPTAVNLLMVAVGCFWASASGALDKARVQAKVEASVNALLLKCGQSNRVSLHCNKGFHVPQPWFLCCKMSSCGSFEDAKVIEREHFQREACADQSSTADNGDCLKHVNGVLDDAGKLGFTVTEKAKCEGYFRPGSRFLTQQSFNANVEKFNIQLANDGAKKFAEKFL